MKRGGKWRKSGQISNNKLCNNFCSDSECLYEDVLRLIKIFQDGWMDEGLYEEAFRVRKILQDRWMDDRFVDQIRLDIEWYNKLNADDSEGLYQETTVN